jgi:hypothetical protein
MVHLLLLAFALAAAQAPAPAASPVVEGAVAIAPRSSEGQGYMATIGSPERFLALICAPGRTFEVMAEFPEEIGFGIAGQAGGHSVRYSFDGGRESRGSWSAAGKAVMAVGRVSAPLHFVRGLRGSRSVRLNVRGGRARVQEVTYRYPDPTAVIDQLAGRCGIDLD